MPPPIGPTLTLDLGNTRDKYAVFQGYALVHAGVGGEDPADLTKNPSHAATNLPGHAATNLPGDSATNLPGNPAGDPPANEPLQSRLDASSLGQILTQFQPAKVMVSNTGPQREALLQWLGNQVPVLMLDADTPLPFRSAYETPQTLGRDRIALAAGAGHRVQNQAVLAIDAGTCLTLDFVDADGVYQGGIIAPGIRMRLQAMHTFTARLPLVQWNGTLQEAPLVGKSTRDCLLAGAVTATCAELDGLIDRYRAQNPGLEVLLTGGDGPALAASMKNRIFAAPHLLMEGLNKILIYNVLERS